MKETFKTHGSFSPCMYTREIGRKVTIPEVGSVPSILINQVLVAIIKMETMFKVT